MKKQQILLINGGNVFASDDDYRQSLEEQEVSLERMRSHDSWKHSLQRDLGEDYDVLFAPMPNSSSAKYSEWKVVFDKVTKLLDNDIILIGHSLGGIFLAKYLSENKFPRKIKAIILLAAPFDDESEESLGDFKFSKLKIEDPIYLLHSFDDKVVNFNEVKKYEIALASYRKYGYMFFEDKGHFNLEKFPELVELLKKL